MELLSHQFDRSGLITARQFETGNARLPGPAVCWRPRDSIILIDIPECAVIHWIEIEGRIVTPAGVVGRLNAGSIDDNALAES